MPTRSAGRITIYDMARHAGVSTATVSRALKDDPLIKLETRTRIRELAEKLSYQPSLTASRLSQGRSGLIGLILPNPGNPFFDALGAAVIVEARRRSHEIIYGHFDSTNLDSLLRSFLSMHLDGIIMEARDWTENSAKIAKLATRPDAIPIVLRRRVDPGYPLDAVYTDFDGAVRTAVQYLLDLGHRRIAYLGDATEERAHAFATAVRKAKAGPRCVCAGCGASPAAAYAEAKRILGGSNPPTAIIAFNDYCAFGVLRAAGELGLSVPGRLSVIGFDDIELASFGTTPLTTMRLSVSDLATRLLDRVLARIAGDRSKAVHQVMHLELVVRGSSGPPPT